MVMAASRTPFLHAGLSRSSYAMRHMKTFVAFWSRPEQCAFTSPSQLRIEEVITEFYSGDVSTGGLPSWAAKPKSGNNNANTSAVRMFVVRKRIQFPPVEI